MKKILNIDHTWKTSLQTRTCLTSNSVFITSLEGVQLKNIFQKTTLRTLLTTGNGNLLLLSLLPKLEKPYQKSLPSPIRYLSLSFLFCLPQQAISLATVPSSRLRIALSPSFHFQPSPQVCPSPLPLSSSRPRVDQESRKRKRKKKMNENKNKKNLPLVEGVYKYAPLR